jgi:hypothetical protein
MGKPTENHDGCIPNIEKHWIYHPMLDGVGPPPEDPLLEKARRLQERGARVIRDAVREEGAGIIHVLEWSEPIPSDDTKCNHPAAEDLQAE